MRKLSVIVAIALFFGLIVPNHAVSGDRYDPRKENVAIDGYDPVAYFTKGEPVRGNAELSHLWQGKTWHFSDRDHLEAFSEEPRRYAPRYGGFCAGAMARGWQAPVDPEAFAIVDGKLYLAYRKSGINEFVDDAENKVPKADANWERVRAKQ